MIQRICRPAARCLDSLDDRHWLLALVGTAVISLLLFYVVLVMPTSGLQDRARNSLRVERASLASQEAKSNKLEAEVATLKAKTDAGAREVGLDANANLDEQLGAMQLQITGLLDVGGVKNSMSTLDALLTEAKGLKVASLKITGTETVVKGSSETPAVYRHSIEVVAHGGYFDVVSYLDALGKISGSTRIASVNYAVREWPMAEVVVKMSAFSTREEWIDVDS